MEELVFEGTREATHAGSWYDDDAERLRAQLDALLDEAEAAAGAAGAPVRPARAVVSPHAGYRYCGRAMAHSYAALGAWLRTLPAGTAPTVVLLGPSHHTPLAGCALTPFARWATPLGACAVDPALCAALHAALPRGTASQLARRTDAAEHSLEMELPFVLRAAARAGLTAPVRIAPMLVGHAPGTVLRALGAALAGLDARTCAVVASSDFCHWGRRFGYTALPPARTPAEAPWARIARLDRAGAALVAAADLAGFEAYLARTGNTICGRDAIRALIAMAQACASGDADADAAADTAPGAVLHYDQSSHCTDVVAGSSVSYCAIALYV